MSLWENANWEEYPDAASQLSHLIKWRTELREAITHGVASNGESINAADIRQTLDATQPEVQRLRALAGARRPIVRTTVTRNRRRGGYAW